ncbi:hypothetical protein ACFSVJ_08500 [Prauserella oleivorans]
MQETEERDDVTQIRPDGVVGQAPLGHQMPLVVVDEAGGTRRQRGPEPPQVGTPRAAPARPHPGPRAVDDAMWATLRYVTPMVKHRHAPMINPQQPRLSEFIHPSSPS